jgi:hypothetical protein
MVVALAMLEFHPELLPELLSLAAVMVHALNDESEQYKAALRTGRELSRR